MRVIEELFWDRPVLAVPSQADAYGRKAPGDQDGPGKGDECC